MPIVPADNDASTKPDPAAGPILPANPSPESNQAADLIREKINRLYASEPDAEATEAAVINQHSSHQQFLYNLTHSGKDLATIQTEWHNYYIQLPDSEKHHVWQEFYASNALENSVPVAASPVAYSPLVLAEHKNNAMATAQHKRSASQRLQSLRTARRSPKDIQAAIRNTVSAGGKLTFKHHLQSLLFGLGIGFVVVFIFLFSFFNEVFIAPFIQPGRVAAATPIIVNSSTVSATSQPEVIIPKINVEIPVDYNETSTNENAIENDLEDGVVHYPTTVMPGQQGNAAFFGHSSNNILNSGKYKFAFVLLHNLVKGDTFYLTYHGTVYIYKVISKTIVSPSDVGVLGPVAGQVATATLITCDPPGTSINRLVVVGQQISPDPSTDTVAAPSAASSQVATTLPGNGPTLWAQVIHTAVGKFVIGIVVVGLFALCFRWVNGLLRRP